jgi:hypothetical protein
MEGLKERAERQLNTPGPRDPKHLSEATSNKPTRKRILGNRKLEEGISFFLSFFSAHDTAHCVTGDFSRAGFNKVSKVSKSVLFCGPWFCLVPWAMRGKVSRQALIGSAALASVCLLALIVSGQYKARRSTLLQQSLYNKWGTNDNNEHWGGVGSENYHTAKWDDSGSK